MLHYLMPLAGSAAGKLGLGGASPYPADQMLANEERLLREFVEVCAQKRIAVILMPINPFYYQIRNTERNVRLSRWAAWRSDNMDMGWEAVIDRFNDVLIGVARQYGRQQGVYVFDVREYLDNQERETLYTDFIHHSPEGNRRVAQGLLEFMRAMEIVTL